MMKMSLNLSVFIERVDIVNIYDKIFINVICDVPYHHIYAKNVDYGNKYKNCIILYCGKKNWPFAINLVILLEYDKIALMFRSPSYTYFATIN